MASVFAVFLASSVCPAQIAPFAPCQFGKVSTIGHAGGITQLRISLVEGGGETVASVFIPDSANSVPGIVFSHSAIRGPNSSADLLRFALALARSGAASIVLDGTMDWRTPNDDTHRPPHLMACAGQWLLLNAKLDPTRLAVAGRLGPWGGGDTPLCLPGEKPCWHPSFVLGFGQTSPVEYQNTERMLRSAGMLSCAQHLQRNLKLSELKPEWLADAVH